MHHSAMIFVYPTSDRLSVCVDGVDIIAQAVEVRKTDQGPLVKVTEASGRVREFSKAGVKDLGLAVTEPTPAERTAATRRAIQRYFDVLEEGCE